MSIDLSGVADMRQRFEAYGAKAFPRAVQYSLNKVAEAASVNFRQALPKALDTPVPFTSRGISFRRARLSEAKLDNLQSAMTVLPVQSTYLKYVLGDGPNTRRPGDVGLARKHVWLPSTENIQKTMGIRSKGGALPAGAAARILARRDEKIPKKPKRVRGMSDEAWDAYDLAWKKRKAAQRAGASSRARSRSKPRRSTRLSPAHRSRWSSRTASAREPRRSGRRKSGRTQDIRA
jgi:hypothetical protein